MSIGVIGAGAFGTALAISLAQNGRDVVLWARDAAQATQMQVTGRNAARLPGIALPKTVTATGMMGDLSGCETLLLAVPMQQLRAMLMEHAAALPQRPYVACCKGIELSSGIGPLSVIEQIVPGASSAILTGPSFAHDIASGLPTALTLACKDKALGEALQQQLTTQNLRLYRTTDTIGAELGGALKNVMAIACGAAIGAGFGDSARAAVMTRGFAEMNRMATALGARAETLAGLSGLGDLTLTCTSDGSRNYRFGLSLGRAEQFDVSITVEGAATARATLAKARSMQIDMPITAAVVALLDGRVQVAEVLEMLLNRPLKEE